MKERRGIWQYVLKSLPANVASRDEREKLRSLANGRHWMVSKYGHLAITSHVVDQPPSLHLFVITNNEAIFHDPARNQPPPLPLLYICHHKQQSNISPEHREIYQAIYREQKDRSSIDASRIEKDIHRTFNAIDMSWISKLKHGLEQKERFAALNRILNAVSYVTGGYTQVTSSIQKKGRRDLALCID